MLSPVAPGRPAETDLVLRHFEELTSPRRWLPSGTARPTPAGSVAGWQSGRGDRAQRRSVGSSLLAGVRVPHLQRLVRATADEAFTVGAEGYAGHRLRVPLEGEELLALVCIPRLH